MMQRQINTEERLFQILTSMRGLNSFDIRMTTDSVPTLKASFSAKNGIINYKYTHSGLIGLNDFCKKFNTTAKEVYERGGEKFVPTWKKYISLIKEYNLALNTKDITQILEAYLLDDSDPTLNVSSFLAQIESYIEKGLSDDMVSDNSAIPLDIVAVIKNKNEGNDDILKELSEKTDHGEAPSRIIFSALKEDNSIEDESPDTSPSFS